MKKRLKNLRDTFIAGLIFLLPLLVLFVLVTKVFKYLTGFTSKLAELFGLSSIMGISGTTIVSGISIILLCIACGYLVRVAFFKSISTWIDEKMASHIPGYSVYRDLALSKLEHKEETLPYKSAAWVKTDNMLQPAFLMDTMPDGKLVIFIPTAGNTKEGTVLLMPDNEVELSTIEIKKFRMAIANLGLGLANPDTTKKLAGNTA